jgi:sortase (surface protein transpeptidase)
MRAALAGLVALLSVALAGCGGLPPVAGPSSSTVSTAPTVAVQPLVPPQQVEVPKINVSQGLVATGLNQDKTAEVPPVTQPLQASYLDWADTQAPIRPIVIFGHINGRNAAGDHVPGIFAHLGQLAAGDDVIVRFADQSVQYYKVTRVEQVPKSGFPTDEVYGPPQGLPADVPARSQIRLITCTGLFDPGSRSYKDNLIVYAQQ